MKRKCLLISLVMTIFYASAGFGQSPTPEGKVDVSALIRKANAAYQANKFLDASGFFQRAAEASHGGVAATNFYNAGCCQALAGNVDDAFALLERAIAAGYANYNNMSSDTDLDNLRGDSRIDTLLERIKPPEIVITTNVVTEARDAQFVFDDVENFLRAMALVDTGADLESTLEKEYFEKATPGLKQLIVKYPFTAKEVVIAIQKRPEEYDNIDYKLALIKAKVSSFRAAFTRFQAFVPDTVFPPTYFLVDHWRGIGSGSPDGLLITIERRTEESISRMETLILHELFHFQQLVASDPEEFYAIFGPKRNLLALTIREGAAEFIALRLTGRMTQNEAHEYVKEHEAETWMRFQPRMHINDTTDWMWSRPSNPDHPRDLAYAFGACIVETYYENATDKTQALKDIMGVIDYPAFLKKSGYAKKFE